ncbi:hypothetical protein TNCV_623381 [Trichonephila clavipes]|nr:hypothetical protein TNCV_623381 [Trichonephila clavipes]
MKVTRIDGVTSSIVVNPHPSIQEGRGRLLWPANEKGRGSCCGPAWVFKKGFLGELEKGESPGWGELEESAKEKESWTVEDPVEWKERRDDERRWRWRIGVI